MTDESNINAFCHGVDWFMVYHMIVILRGDIPDLQREGLPFNGVLEAARGEKVQILGLPESTFDLCVSLSTVEAMCYGWRSMSFPRYFEGPQR